MPKRQREQPLQFNIQTDNVIIDYFGDKYVWNPPSNIHVKSFLNEDVYEYTINNHSGVHLFNVENVRNNTDVLCQKIKKLKEKRSKECS